VTFPFHGRLLDLDSHLQLPGSVVDALLARADDDGLSVTPLLEQLDVEPQAVEGDVWATKGSKAPGAASPRARVAVLDRAGIARQLVLPRVRIAAHAWTRDCGARIAEDYNRFAAAWAADHSDRLLAVGISTMHDPGAATAQITQCAELGLAGVMAPAMRVPGGISPAAPAWDPVWSALQDAGIPLILHAGADKGFLDARWSSVEVNRGAAADDVDAADDLAAQASSRLKVDVETVGPFDLTTLHFGIRAFLTVLSLEGVFERFPGLRVGAIEVGASWVGPWAEEMDRAADVFAHRLAGRLARRPSEYLADHLRVTPYHWEPVYTLIDRHGLPEIYAFSSDYPHAEGGDHPVEAFLTALEGASPEIVADFYTVNGALLTGATSSGEAA
jgi:uncharacterized protein